MIGACLASEGGGNVFEGASQLQLLSSAIVLRNERTDPFAN
jgi:hypothetical protein